MGLPIEAFLIASGCFPVSNWVLKNAESWRVKHVAMCGRMVFSKVIYTHIHPPQALIFPFTLQQVQSIVLVSHLAMRKKHWTMHGP